MIIVPFESGTSTASPTAKHRGKEIGKITFITTVGIVSFVTIERATASCKRITSGVSLLLPGLFKLFGMFPVLSVLIVFFSFFRIAQDLVCLIELLKKLCSFGIIGVQIGVMFTRQFPIGLFY